MRDEHGSVAFGIAGMTEESSRALVVVKREAQAEEGFSIWREHFFERLWL